MSALPARTSRPDGRASLSETLTSVADELEQTRALGFRVERAVCAMAIQSKISGEIVAELQQLDLVLQQIAALRDFLAQVAAACDHSQIVDISAALERVTLAELRARLAGSPSLESEEGWEML